MRISVIIKKERHNVLIIITANIKINIHTVNLLYTKQLNKFYFITVAGFPKTEVFLLTFRITTLPMPTVDSSSIVVFGIIDEFDPIKTDCPILQFPPTTTSAIIEVCSPIIVSCPICEMQLINTLRMFQYTIPMFKTAYRTLSIITIQTNQSLTLKNLKITIKW